MPQFHYDSPVNPYTASVGELLAHRGDIEARRAEAIGLAQARAAQVSGLAWAGATQQIGQSVAGAIQQQNDPRQQLEREQLAQVQRENKSRNIFEAELKNPANYKPDGTVDDAAISERLKQQDVGAWQHWTAISQANQKNSMELAAKALEIQKNSLDIQGKQREWQHAQTAYLGTLAYHASDILQQSDDPLHARDTVLASVARAAADGAVSESEAKQFLMQSAAASPDQLGQVFASLVPPELKAKLDKEKAETAKATADAAKASAEAANITQFGSATPPPSQTHNMRLKGVGDVPVDYVPNKGGMGGKWFYQGKEVTGDVSVIPAASVTIHNEKETKGAENRGELAEMVRTGLMSPSMLSKRADDYNDILATASRKNREETGKPLNIEKMQLDYEAAKKWIASQNAPQMVRFKGLASSVVNTIDEVKTLSDELKQGGLQKWNSVKRSTIQQVYGNTPQSDLANRYMIAVNTLKEEFANLANGGYAPTEDAWKLANSQINEDYGVKDMSSALTEVQRLINYRVKALGDVAPATMPDRDAVTPPKPETPKASAIKDGTEGTVNGRPAVWKTVNGTTGWYAK